VISHEIGEFVCGFGGSASCRKIIHLRGHIQTDNGRRGKKGT
jgi:hypothetical protein